MSHGQAPERGPPAERNPEETPKRNWLRRALGRGGLEMSILSVKVDSSPQDADLGIAIPTGRLVANRRIRERGKQVHVTSEPLDKETSASKKRGNS